jgi:peptidoglycan/xylan/chitin deacetylase (PgdA/CDA1 family)
MTEALAATTSRSALFDPAIRAALNVVGGRGHSGRLSTLIFHRVLPEPDPLFPGEMHRERFESVCSWVANWFNVLPLEQAIRRMVEGSLPRRALAITFDDGYADNHDIAAPILLRHGLSATFFIATGFLDGGRMFNDTVIDAVRRTKHESIDVASLELGGLNLLPLATIEQRRLAIEKLIAAVKYIEPGHRQRLVDELALIAGAGPAATDLMMTCAQVRSLFDNGMQIGAHTRNHPILARMSAAQAKAEIQSGKADLEEIIEDKVALFAYPNGQPDVDYTADSISAVRAAGFVAAMSTTWGVSRKGDDLFQLPRFTPWDRGPLGFALRSIRNFRQKQ